MILKVNNLLERVLFFLVLFLFAFIPLYPKIPLLNIQGTFVAIRLEDLLISLTITIWVVYSFRNKSWEFFTKEIGLPAERLWVTCFEGDEKLSLPKDIESAEIWKSLGVPQEHVRFYDSKKIGGAGQASPHTCPRASRVDRTLRCFMTLDSLITLNLAPSVIPIVTAEDSLRLRIPCLWNL